jgi:glycerol-3-phosphate O-acyltransferase/dihydroxyacetone phosphate acyltransferase
VRIIPVGLTFEEKGRFRSRALVNVGKAIDPALEVEEYALRPREAVRALTRRVKEGLEGVTLNFPSWEEARWIQRAAEIYERPSSELPAEQPLSLSFPLRQSFVQGYLDLCERCPREVEKLVAAVQTYDQHLEDLRLEDEQVAAEYSTSGVLRFTLKSLGLLLLRLPLAALGTVIHCIPFFAASWVARRQSSEDVLATYKIIASIVFYPLTWLLLATLAGWQLGGWVGLALLLLAPLSGLMALRFFERRGHFLRQVRAYFVLKSGRRKVEDLRELRWQVLCGVRDLVDVAQKTS